MENGFDTRTTSVLSFIDGTRTFSIAPTGVSFTYFSGGTQFVSTGASVAIPDSEGIHFFYFNDSGVLTSTQIFLPTIITTFAYVGAIYWDATNNTALIVAEERHGREMAAVMHSYLHNTQHTRWQQGFSPLDIVADGDGSSDTHAQIGVEDGIMWDEDITHVITGDPKPLTAPFLYRLGAAGDWRQIASSGFVVTTTGSGRAAWNEFTGGAWQLTELTSGDLMLMHLVATNSIADPRYRWVLGQNKYATLALARAGAEVELRNMFLGSLGTLRNFAHEFVSIASFVIQSAGYTNAVKSRIRTTETGASFIDWRGVTLT